ncbi:nucleoside phosphorylase [Rhizobium sp. BK650]|uniref:phosphorylase family protein n=1 Tax=Rhizobium sp. BK650 TaxID=2586990 RepID=UPI0018447D19|nr:phosphorylase [Rhizobium sp. BK650]MBB3660042.1 nucleoside phosphorylase [Rhizobium sp. BK650]
MAADVHHDTGRPESDMQPNQVLEEIVRKRAAVYKRLNSAVINAIPHELAATEVIFGDAEVIPTPFRSDLKVRYVTLQDKVGNDIYVAIAGTTGQGIAQAAAATARVVAKCHFLKRVVLIGIAAGQPNLSDKEKDVRLGDVVVGDKLIQYDHVKRSDGKFLLRGDNIAPGDRELLDAVDRLRSLQERTGPEVAEKPWDGYIRRGSDKVRSSTRPDGDRDPNSAGRNYTKGLTYQRPADAPYLHVGTIGSASTLLKDEKYRDKLNQAYGMIAYEMEGAGVAIAAASAGLAYLNVRGICDYGDVRKNDDWQTYASVCAAAVARAILEEF